MASGLIYAPLKSAAYSALSGYQDQTNETSDWLKKIMASNQAAQKSIMDAKAQQMQNEQEAVPASMGLKGAQIGSMFGPYGTAAGAIAGGLVGAGSDFSTRMKHGDGILSSAGHTLWDVVNPVNIVHALSSPGGTEAAAGVAGSLAKSRNSTAMKGAANDALSSAAFGSGSVGKSNEGLSPTAMANTVISGSGVGGYTDSQGIWHSPDEVKKNQTLLNSQEM
jgi:hypothetical protein